jgi:hypothetical protein
VIYDAFLHLGYNGDALVYSARMSMAHSIEQGEANVTIPLNPTEPWMASIISVELDDIVEQTAQVALTSMCATRLSDIAAMPIVLFSILY